MPQHDRPEPRSNDDSTASTSARSAAGRTRQTLMVALLLIAVLVPSGVTLGMLWSHLGADRSLTGQEREGLAYISPLVRLIAVASDAQSRAVSGTTPDADQLQAAVHDVETVDQSIGDELRTRDRWAAARRQLETLLAGQVTGVTAYTKYSQAVDLLTALATSVGDTTNLVVDPDLDSHYIMDVTLNRVPSIVVSAGRLSDLNRLQNTYPGRAAELVVAVDDVRRQSAAVDSEFRKSFGTTQNGTLTPALVNALDAFGDDVNSLAPPTAGYTVAAQSIGKVTAARQRVKEAALSLESAGLIQLDGLLKARIDDLAGQQQLVLALTLAGLLLLMAVLWFRSPQRARRREAVEDDAIERELHGGGPFPAGPPPDERDDGQNRQLVRVGRAVAAQRSKR